MRPSEDEILDLVRRLGAWPEGYVEGDYEGAKWGATLARGADGKRLTLFARALGGADFISGNFYVLDAGVAARPCEMPLAKVAAFIRGFRVSGPAAN